MAIVTNIDEVRQKATEAVLNKNQTPSPELKPNSETPPATTEVKAEAPTFSIDSLSDDDLIAQLNKRNLNISKPELSEEEKIKAQQIEDVEKLKFYVENNLIAPERYSELKSIINSDGLELTKKEFVKSFKNENKNATQSEIDEAYAEYYTINVGEPQTDDEGVPIPPKYSERQNKWGKDRQDTKADRIKKDAESELKSLEARFKTFRHAESKVKEYTKTVGEVISALPKEKFTTNIKVGKEEIPVTIDLDAKSTDGAKDYLINTFGGYALQKEKLPTKDELTQNATGYIALANQDKIYEKLAEYFKGAGLREGAIGGNQPLEKSHPLDVNRPNELEAQAIANIPKEIKQMPKRSR